LTFPNPLHLSLENGSLLLHLFRILSVFLTKRLRLLLFGEFDFSLFVGKLLYLLARFSTL
jgi:hypothetical protein